MNSTSSVRFAIGAIEMSIYDTAQKKLQKRSCIYALRSRTHGNVFLRFCIVSSNELVVLDSLENSKQYKNAGKRFRRDLCTGPE